MTSDHLCKCIVLMLLISACLIPVLSAQAYYRCLSFTHSPLYAIRGVKASTFHADVALYEFTYDNEQISCITYKLNGKPKPLYENYTSSNYIWAAQNCFEYERDEVTIRHLDYSSMPILNKPAISVFKLDSLGRAVQLNYFDLQGNPTEFNKIHEYQWTYFDDTVGEIRFSKSGEPQIMNTWFPYTWVLLHFDDDQIMTSITTTAADWQTSENAIRIEFEKDQDEIVGWKAFLNQTNQPSHDTGPKVAETRHEFDVNGYLIRTRFFDEKGERMKAVWGHMGFVRNYNAQGNRLSYNFINEADEITLAPDRGYSGQKFLWDKEGRFRLHTSYIDLDGGPIVRESAGYAQIQYLYNSAGSAIGQVYKDAAGQVLCNGTLESFIWLEDTAGTKSKKDLCH